MHVAGFEAHNHTDCIASALAAAEDHCRASKLQFTPVRRRVLEILLGAHKGLGAYEILPILSAEGLGSQPPVVYRALDFLIAQGIAHKVEKKNAFIACAHPGKEHSPAFLICRACEGIAEAAADRGVMQTEARAAGFHIENAIVEVEGLCPACRDAEPGKCAPGQRS